MFNDLLWADPLKTRLATTMAEMDNEERCISVKFGKEVLDKLLKSSNTKALIRAHQQKDQGYKLHMWDGNAVGLRN